MAGKKKLYRSKKDRVLTGLAGGLGDYFDIDPTLVRLGWLLIVVFTGLFPGIIVYFVAALLVPLQSK